MRNARIHLAMLLLASVAIVCTLLLVMTDAAEVAIAAGHIRTGLVFGLVVALGTLAIAFILRPRVPPSDGIDHEEIGNLRRDLLANEAIVSAENQVLIYWEQGQRARLLTHTLITVPGLPSNAADLERFGAWLEAKSAEELKAGLDALFNDGRAFDILIRTRAGGYVEADGRAAGGRAVLRLRDVV
ncbi:MAG TPA: histidine kinase, partial [Hyphomicrobiaceae bacterium]|nr:histidine kinase [Hyphomicrobiaceae bacterium]